MTEYSVAIGNRFALDDLSEDEDLHDLLARQQAEKKRKDELAAEAAKAAAEAAAAKAKSDKRGSAKSGSKKPGKVNEAKPAQTSNTTSANARSYPRSNDENRPPRFANRPVREGGENVNFEKPPQFDRPASRGRGGGRGFNRGRGGSAGPRVRREFDRHSGSDKTGVKAVEKRDGNGPHNWGDEIESQLQAPETPAVAEGNEADAAGNAEMVVPESTQESGPAEPEEPKVMTLDEWKASKGQAKTKSDFNVRKANEGADQKQWKGTVALQKKKKGDAEEEEEYESADEDEMANTKSALEKLHIEIKFTDNESRSGTRGRGRGRGGFGPRGGGRGRGFKGGFSDRRSDGNNAVPRVDNEKDFPSLGGR